MQAIFNTTVSDFRNGWGWRNAWVHMAWNDIIVRYRGSKIGPLWITLSTLIQISILGFLYPKILGFADAQYIPWIIVSIVTWQFISSSITDFCTTLTSGRPVYLNQKVPFSFFFYKQIFLNVLVFIHQLPIIFFSSFFFNISVNLLSLLQFFIGLFLVSLFCLSLGGIISILSLRYQDVPPIVANFLNVLFMATPVFWMPRILGENQKFLYLNPFYDMLELLRAPFLNESITFNIYLLDVIIISVQSILFFIVFSFCRKKIPVWQ